MGVWFITSGKVVQCVQTAKCDDVAMVAWGQDKHIQYNFLSSPIYSYIPPVI